MNEVIHIVSKEKDYWKKEEVERDRMYEDTLELTGEKRQEILGFGGCFNELGWDERAIRSRRLCLQYGTCPHRGQ